MFARKDGAKFGNGAGEDKDPADSVKNPPDLLAFSFPVQTFVWRRGAVVNQKGNN